MFKKLLVANRGEIARRIFRTCRGLGIGAVAVYSDADSQAAHVEEADEAHRLGGAPAPESYLRGDLIIEAALKSGADAVHPGYGFLSENAAFAENVEAVGLTWIGPSPQTIRDLGDKVRAREIMASIGFPVTAGGLVDTPEEAQALAARIGFPLMLKAAAGGGGIGMKVVREAADLAAACERGSAQAARLFGSPTLLIERYLEGARHVEVQILGLADGRALALGERDCSTQRRFQKIAEESPCPGLSPALRARLLGAAAQAATTLGYKGAGTIECLVHGDDFVFLEVNTRLQVEHPVTELVTGIDLVDAQLRIAAGEAWEPRLPERGSAGHALELRVYAEDPRTFLPGPGRITAWQPPQGPGVRLDAGYREGDVVTPFYDPLMAKLCVYGRDRDEALARARKAVGDFVIAGPKSNLPFLASLLDEPAFVAGSYDTRLVDQMQRAN
jgi:acetyl-CoA carboxylase biotin carboxylase subunit